MKILVLVSFILGFSILLPSFPTVPSTPRALTLLPNAPLLTLKGCGGLGWLCELGMVCSENIPFQMPR